MRIASQKSWCLWLQVGQAAVEIHYGAGIAEGFTVSDTLRVGDPEITIVYQKFAEQWSLSEQFLNYSCDGLFVSALDSSPRQNLHELLEAMARKVFWAVLPRDG